VAKVVFDVTAWGDIPVRVDLGWSGVAPRRLIPVRVGDVEIEMEAVSAIWLGWGFA
jgi:hypothetical protein